jgi:DNA-binding response OmpR family regulator
MATLRKKLEPDPEHPKFLVGVRGVGYRFDGDLTEQ